MTPAFCTLLATSVTEVRRTPMVLAEHDKQRLEGRVLMKLECLQVTGSFKPRGAMNTLRSLAPAYCASFTLSEKATVFQMRARSSSIVCSLSSCLGGVCPESQAAAA